MVDRMEAGFTAIFLIFIVIIIVMRALLSTWVGIKLLSDDSFGRSLWVVIIFFLDDLCDAKVLQFALFIMKIIEHNHLWLHEDSRDVSMEFIVLRQESCLSFMFSDRVVSFEVLPSFLVESQRVFEEDNYWTTCVHEDVVDVAGVVIVLR